MSGMSVCEIGRGVVHDSYTRVRPPKMCGPVERTEERDNRARIVEDNLVLRRHRILFGNWRWGEQGVSVNTVDFHFRV